MIRIIGDTHADNKTKMARYLKVAQASSASIQIGDMNVGFEGVDLPQMPTHKFFRGNHDNPQACYAHPNYLGDYGYWEEKGIYWMGGAFSVDGRTNPLRVRGRTWCRWLRGCWGWRRVCLHK